MNALDEKLPPRFRVLRTELSIEEEPEEEASLAAPLAPRKAAAPKRPASVVSIVRRRDRARDVQEAARAHLAELAKIVRGVSRIDERAVRFEDGTLGVSVTLGFEPAPGARAAQRHVFKLADGMLAHATATVEERKKDRLDALELIMCSLLAER
jgi:hypothetical protein